MYNQTNNAESIKDATTSWLFSAACVAEFISMNQVIWDRRGPEPGPGAQESILAL